MNNTGPPQVLADVLTGPLEPPERLIRTVLTVWDDPEHGQSLRAFAEAALRDPEVNRLFAEVAEREMIRRLADRIGGADAVRRAAGVASQLAGMIMTRYILRFEPLASKPPDELTRLITPPVRATLAGPRRSPLRSLTDTKRAGATSPTGFGIPVPIPTDGLASGVAECCSS